jgi:prevent-host-death family protein
MIVVASWTSRGENAAGDPTAWTVSRARARFGELIERAGTQGPQAITQNGRIIAVVVSAAEWERKTTRTGNLAEFFAASPLRGVDRTFERR